MAQQISVNTRFGWISAFENKGKIFRIKFGKLKQQNKIDKTKTSQKNDVKSTKNVKDNLQI